MIVLPDAFIAVFDIVVPPIVAPPAVIEPVVLIAPLPAFTAPLFVVIPPVEIIAPDVIAFPAAFISVFDIMVPPMVALPAIISPAAIEFPWVSIVPPTTFPQMSLNKTSGITPWLIPVNCEPSPMNVVAVISSVVILAAVRSLMYEPFPIITILPVFVIERVIALMPANVIRSLLKSAADISLYDIITKMILKYND